ncbi:hypothetical protein IMG5_053240 [Ichthyophthirius multifiliis]|uniref:Uncharacterized protein n=1 Tax=Ichthyophthirius multifiliis TaxID=5932 RepID=G0QMX3_ICHMU|nr:hypothetical protein IMG5_053240 [Ichthyophthirius multifiliis]EGR33432.1 hypothetical protein IMG5_053240 [Ichthyophthirius multifiliis]|eukprot:XP_004037418.1 hypothetical protein IMG5_053240 [Ichthyophthirius multifiliis]
MYNKIYINLFVNFQYKRKKYKNKQNLNIKLYILLYKQVIIKIKNKFSYQKQTQQKIIYKKLKIIIQFLIFHLYIYYNNQNIFLQSFIQKLLLIIYIKKF